MIGTGLVDLTRAFLALAFAAVGAQATPVERPRIEISVAERRLWVITTAGDTLRAAPVAVGSGDTLRTESRTWIFRTPLGATVVTGKETAPLWVAPDWHYVEQAQTKGLRLVHIPSGGRVSLADDRALVARGDQVGVVGADGVFDPLPSNHPLTFDGTLYVPPIGTRNRRIAGVLGAYRLQLANGIGLHGTADTASIGAAASHGCIRLRDEDIAWLHARIPIGTRVIIR